jgi:hypothetical protein
MSLICLPRRVSQCLRVLGPVSIIGTSWCSAGFWCCTSSTENAPISKPWPGMVRPTWPTSITDACCARRFRRGEISMLDDEAERDRGLAQGLGVFFRNRLTIIR